jgi:hypothetical protein
MKSPHDYYINYVKAVYDTPLGKAQRAELGCAFHAGVEAVFKFVEEYEADEDELFNFRRLNKSNALTALGYAKTQAIPDNVN